MPPSIQVSDLSKTYRLGERLKITTLRDAAANLVRRAVAGRGPRQNGTPGDDILWALRDVSFNVQQGEVVGVVGRNGAGKSTLLKILSRITEPTRGRVRIRGRVASLLEVGTGFHPELTGRENVFLNGVILGMRKDEIRSRFDEIVAFAEIERFIDTPVKRYSSGMYVRLAFSVAAHLQPEILLVDEVLAVGDIGFQQKCLGKMNEVSTAGRTIVFVSHNLGAVRGLCSRCLAIEGGQVVSDASPAEAISAYVALTVGKGSRSRVTLPRRPDVPIQVTRLWLQDELERPIDEATLGVDAYLCMEYLIERDARDVTMAVLVGTQDTPLLYSYDTDMDVALREPRRAGRYRARVRLPLSLFKEGLYVVRVKIGYARTELTDPDAYISLEIAGDQDFTHHSYRRDRPGVLMKPIPWQTECDPIGETVHDILDPISGHR